jgi:hypothetical protein
LVPLSINPLEVPVRHRRRHATRAEIVFAEKGFQGDDE